MHSCRNLHQRVFADLFAINWEISCVNLFLAYAVNLPLFFNHLMFLLLAHLLASILSPLQYLVRAGGLSFHNVSALSLPLRLVFGLI